jgi:hypothetical protein
MNDEQLKIIRTLQWIFYPIALIMLAAFAWRMFGGQGSLLNEEMLSLIGSLEAGVMFALAGLFWLVFVALAIEFVGKEMSGAMARKDMGAVRLEIRRPRTMTIVIFPLAALVLVAGLNVLAFSAGSLNIDVSAIGLSGTLMFSLFYAIGHFMLIVLILRAIRNRPFFILTERGFLYEPGDLSPGLVLWQDIAGLQEADLLAQGTSRTGPTLMRSLVVDLKEPDRYIGRYNPLLRQLHRTLIGVLRIQTGGRGDIVLEAPDFGERYAAVRSLMADSIRAAGGKTELL